MKCPLKFARYEFEGGETCIGAECGFFGGVCDMDMSESVQKRPNELPEGDAVKLMREFCIKDILDALGIDCRDKHHTRKMVQALADMVERDYVRREHYYERVKELGAERDELEMRVNSLVAELGDTEGTSIILERQRDEWKAKAEQAELRSNDGVTNLEWLFENDYEKLCDQMGGQPCSCCVVGCKEDLGSDEACAKALHDWLMAPHDDTHSKAQSKTEPKLSEQSESLSDESDSREKLEADAHSLVAAFTYTYSDESELFGDVIRLLDRQAAITERECLVQSVQGADAILTAENAELQAAYDELTEIAAQLCRACGFSMCDAAGEVIS